MNEASIDLIGGAWLATQYGIEPVMPLATVSRIGGRRSTQIDHGATTQTYVESMRPDANQGKLSNALSKEIPALAENGVWDAICQAIEDAFREGPTGDAVDRYTPGKAQPDGAK